MIMQERALLTQIICLYIFHMVGVEVPMLSESNHGSRTIVATVGRRGGALPLKHS